MLGLILIGGMGTRLRPFTCDTPKPLLPVINKPFLYYQLEILKRHGILDVVLCTFYQSDMFRRLLGNGERLGMRLKFVKESMPLGTAGAIKNAEAFIKDTVLVLNGDILNTLDITSFLEYHRQRKADLSIALTRVKEPTLYGLVSTDKEGRVTEFLEKPALDQVKTDTINAGAYLMEPHLLKLIPKGIAYSLERSLFPYLVEQGSRVFGYVANGYWIDIGTVDNYLRVHLDILAGRTPFRLNQMGRGKKEGVAVGSRAIIKDFSRFSGQVCIGPKCIIGRDVSLKDCVVLENTKIGDGARLEQCVVGANCNIGPNAVLASAKALAGGSSVKAYSHL